MQSKLRSLVCPLLAAFLWGVAFVAQKGNTTGVFAFLAARSFVAVPFLLVLILIVTRGDVRHLLREQSPAATRSLWVGGVLCGTFLFIASALQQYGMDSGTEAGKAGFLTALYMVLVPLLGLFMHKKCGKTIWVSIALAVGGLYLMCIGGSFTIRTSDIFVLGCALFFALQIRAIDAYSVKCNCVKLSCVQFLVCGTLSLVTTLLFEDAAWGELTANVWPILYLGIFSSGIAYTLQMVAQKGNNPAVVSVLLSMESVFSVLSGAVLLQEKMLPREYIGCLLMFAAVLCTQFLTEEVISKWLEKRKQYVQK